VFWKKAGRNLAAHIGDLGRAEPALGSALVFLASLLLYLHCLLPSVAWSDGASYQKNCALLRLGTSAWSHPLYVVIGKLFTELPVGRNLAYRVTLVSAFFGSLALALLYWASFRLSSAHLDVPRPAASLSALLAAGWLGTSHTFWLHAVQPEVYTLHASFLVGIFLVLFESVRRQSKRLFALAWFLVGVAMTNHVLVLLCVPAFVLYSYWSRERPGSRGTTCAKNAFVGAGAFLLGSLPYWVLLTARWVSAPAPNRPAVLKDAVGAGFLTSLFPVGSGALQRGVGGVLEAYWFAAHLVFINLLPAGLVFGVLGLFVLGRKARPVGRALAAGVGVNALFAMNFFVRDQFAFFLSSYVLWAFFVGAGALPVMVRRGPPGSFSGSSSEIRWWAVPILVAATILLPVAFSRIVPGVFGDHDTRMPPFRLKGGADVSSYLFSTWKGDDWSAYRYGSEALARLEGGAWLVAASPGDYDAWAVLDYFQVVEGRRPDVTLFPPGHMPRIEEAPGSVYLLSPPEEALESRYDSIIVRPEGDLYRVIRVVARTGEGRRGP
jgi:hypothetical protein